MSRALLSSTGLVLLMLTSTAAFAAKSPQDFIKDAIQGDNSEIMLGQLAQQKAGDQGVRDFGATLVTDHSQAKQQATDVAKSLGVTPPDQPTQGAEQEKAKLSNLSGDSFDHEFANYMVQDHQKDIQEFQDEANANNGPASDLAKKQLPVLEKHLQMAQALLGSAAQKSGSSSATLRSAPSQETPDEWRASKLAGVSIYGPNNKKVGDITDILMSKDGNAEYVVIGVGGFLGIGQKDVAIPYKQVTFSSQPIAQNGTGSANSGSGGAPGGGAVKSTAQVSPGAGGAKQSAAYPDHGTIDMTADQLKSAPSFKFAQ